MRLIYKLLIAFCIISIKPLLAEENSEATFGKTHFIVGYTEDKKPAEESGDNKEQPTQEIRQDIPYNLVCNDCVKCVYFSPDDNVRSVLLYLIEQETKYIQIAMFNFTERKLAQALIDAHARGVEIEVVVDPSNVYNPYGKLSLLHQGGVKLFVYNPRSMQKNVPSLMHNKFVVFGNNILGKSLVCTGSFNFTRAAHHSNQENVLILDDSTIVTRYGKKFEQLKEYSDYYQKRNAVRQTKRHSI
jgi:phosphatidylserine/phosphatidylglycerophosphate/cardiolipin synthase-like enzyme